MLTPCTAMTAGAAVLAAALSAGASSVWYDREITRLRLDWTERQVQAVDAMHDEWVAAQARGDALTRQLARERAAAAQLRKERNDALGQLTDGRVCLREPALRMLDGAPGLVVELPGAGGGVDGTDAGHVATDAHVAGWALAAGEQYTECVRRFGALIEWNEGGAGAR